MMKASWFLMWIWGAGSMALWFMPWLVTFPDDLQYLFLLPAIGATAAFLVLCFGKLLESAEKENKMGE